MNGKRGETAGYFFFENADGFHFKSIDSLFAQEHVKSYIYGGQPTSSIAYDGEIVNLGLTIDLRQSKVKNGCV